MKRFLLPLAAVAIAGLLLPAGVRPAYACSCALLSTEEYVNNADVIAIGTVVQLIETAEQFPPVEEESDGIIPDIDAVVAVERYLKGDGPAEVRLCEGDLHRPLRLAGDRFAVFAEQVKPGEVRDSGPGDGDAAEDALRVGDVGLVALVADLDADDDDGE